jgi:G3E family GTPase
LPSRGAAAPIGDPAVPDIVPVTILTGFLGSGKTTLLNRVLRSEHGRKIAVIVNEFGEVGIDAALLQGGERFVELDNGCLCCALNSDLVATLAEIGDREGIDQVIIETTGIADPLPVGHAVLRPELEGHFRLDAIVATVDCLNVERGIAEANEAALQIRRADVVLMAKCDLVNARRRAEVRALIETHNPNARVLHSDDPAAIPLLLDAHVEGELQLFKPEEPDPYATPRDGARHLHHDHDHDHDHEHPPTHGFRSVAIQLGERTTLRLAFQEFLEQMPRGIYRSKGIVKLEGEPGRLIFHTVGGRVDLWHDPKSREPGRLVLVGRDFPLETMRDEVEALFSAR